MKKYIVFAGIFICIITICLLNIDSRTVFFNKLANFTTAANSTETKYLIPGGQAFGVKFYTDGVIVIDISSFESDKGEVSPAKDAGIKISDIIIAVNGQKVYSNSDISHIVNSATEYPIKITMKRNNEFLETTVYPELCISQNSYRIGLWVRDSTAGIGTVTYFDRENNILAGLGHGISDIDTGILMPMAKGQVIGTKITGAVIGKRGEPGQLTGTFDENILFGELITNSEIGLYASISENSNVTGAPIPVGYKNEVYQGDAQIICTVSGNTPEYYDVQIESINPFSGSSKNMTIKITDEDLLNATGGIVQGMSGSPIIQDGKLVGAVTHVLVNDPHKGYGIFIENMLEIAQDVSEQQLRKAS